MNLLAPMVLGLFLTPLPDLATPGFKKVVQEVAVENPGDFEGWKIVSAMFLGPSHVTLVKPNVPFRYSSKYTTRLYALPSDTPIPTRVEGKRVPREVFADFLSTGLPVTLPSSVSVISPVEKTLTTIRIISISDNGIELETVSEVQFDGDDDTVGWFRLWGIPVGSVILGVAGLICLRRRRLQRAAE